MNEEGNGRERETLWNEKGDIGLEACMGWEAW